jgi:hypothetical protein
MKFIPVLASPSKSQCDFETVSIVHDLPDIAYVGGQELRVVFICGLR